jgi:hypothetical protein
MRCHLNWKPREGALKETLVSLKGIKRRRGLNAWLTNGIKMTPPANKVRGAFVTRAQKPLKAAWHQRRLPALNKAINLIASQPPWTIRRSAAQRCPEGIGGRGALFNTRAVQTWSLLCIFVGLPTNNEKHVFFFVHTRFNSMIARLGSFHCVAPHSCVHLAWSCMIWWHPWPACPQRAQWAGGFLALGQNPVKLYEHWPQVLLHFNLRDLLHLDIYYIEIQRKNNVHIEKPKHFII